jgi:hypothetical protein
MPFFQYNASKLRRSFFEKNEAELIESVERKTGNRRRFSTVARDSSGRVLTSREIHAVEVIQKNFRIHMVRRLYGDVDRMESLAWRKLRQLEFTHKNDSHSSPFPGSIDECEELAAFTSANELHRRTLKSSAGAISTSHSCSSLAQLRHSTQSAHSGVDREEDASAGGSVAFSENMLNNNRSTEASEKSSQEEDGCGTETEAPIGALVAPTPTSTSLLQRDRNCTSFACGL